jgi:hypothetical protein
MAGKREKLLFYVGGFGTNGEGPDSHTINIVCDLSLKRNGENGEYYYDINTKQKV